MPLDDKANTCRAPVTRSRLWKTYCQTVGAVQVRYAAFFGWHAFDDLS
ncbi:MAG: hypothetical protein ACP5XB_03385 [Isosphaeraceae bacterium]